ncbi:MAG: DNRLRE domain-containing protein [Planctomycetota bacterium]
MFTLRSTSLLVLAFAHAVAAQPTQQTEQTLTAAADTYVDSASPTTNFGGDLFLRISNTSSPFATFNERTLVRFDLSTMGAFNLTKATLRFSHAGEGYLDVHRVTSSWQENSVTWRDQPSFDSQSLGTLPSTRASTKTLDVTDTVRAWLTGAEPNNGLVFILQDTGFFGVSTHIFSREAAQGVDLVLSYDNFFHYGSSCGFDMTGSGDALRGASYTIRGSGGTGGVHGSAILTVGVTATWQPISVTGFSGCQILSSSELAVVMQEVSGEFAATIPVPTSLAFVGSTIYHQGARVILRRGQPDEMTLSQGIAVTIYDN